MEGSPLQVDALGADRFKVSGELDMSVADTLIERVMRHHAEGTGDVTLDLSELQFMDSSGLHGLVRIAQSLGDDRRLILESPRAAVARLLDVVGTAQFPNIEVRQDEDTSPQ